MKGFPSTRYFRLGYRPALDGVRAIAILLVMMFHSKLSGVQGGFLGVDLFFVLSGFLITTLLVQEFETTGTIHLGQFYKRRFLRLFPAVAFFIIVYIGVNVAAPSTFLVSLLESGVILGYITNWVLAFDKMSMAVISHTWSLAVEEQFYILFPLVLGWVVPRLTWARVRTLMLIGVGVVMVVRGVLWASGAEWYRLYYGSDTRADALLWGCWLGVTLSTTPWHRSFWVPWAYKALGPALIVLGILINTSHILLPYQYLWAFPLTALICTLLLFYLVTAPRTQLHHLLELPILVWIGRLSYGLYLWHFPIYNVLLAMDMTPLQVFVFGTPLSFAVALLSYFVVERPFLRRKNEMAVSPMLARAEA
jgi:peptidoglycan/LPS O-acetylase OafA/YrhL